MKVDGRCIKADVRHIWVTARTGNRTQRFADRICLRLQVVIQEKENTFVGCLTTVSVTGPKKLIPPSPVFT